MSARGGPPPGRGREPDGMEIIGDGFLARSLRPIRHAHPGTVAVAAGVSGAGNTSRADYDREAALVHEVIRRCRATGRRLLFFSTASAGMYGATAGPGREDDPVTPCTPYGAHKLALEDAVRAGAADHLVLRLTHVVGPGQPPHQLLPALIRQIRHGRVRVDRRAARDLIAVDDAVRVIDRLLARGLTGQTVNVACGHPTPVETLVGHLERRLGLSPRHEYRDTGLTHHVSTTKMHALVPEAALMGFGPLYYRRAVDLTLGLTTGPAPGPTPRDNADTGRPGAQKGRT